MNLTSVDWNNAKNLLIQLVHALSPLAIQKVHTSIFLNRRFFIPHPSSQEDFFISRFSVKLLITLYSLQKEVEEWIRVSPQKEGEKIQELSKKNTEPLKRSEFQNFADISKPITASKNESVFKTIPSMNIKTTPQEQVSLARLAKEMIHQVQEAIVQLSTSENIQHPKALPLLKTLKELKPKLDRIIKTVAECYKNQAAEKEVTHSQFRHLVPVSPRQSIITKLNKMCLKKPFCAPKAISKPTENISFCLEGKEENLPIQKTKVKKTTHLKETLQNLCEPKKNEEKHLIPVVMHGEKAEKGEPLKDEIRTIFGVIVPHQPKELNFVRKKKKRKGFGFKENERSKDDSK